MRRLAGWLTDRLVFGFGVAVERLRLELFGGSVYGATRRVDLETNNLN